jgi:hypothetical protein
MRLEYGSGQPKMVRAAAMLKSRVQNEGRDAGIGVRVRCRFYLLWAGTCLADANFL